jgi:arabinofuranan 3-O-arabinosyltransferase
VLVELSYRALAGGAPAICVWEEGPDVCATIPSLSDVSGWHHLQVVVTPEPRTQRLLLFLYATPSSVGQAAVSEFADVSVYDFTTRGQPILIGTPERRQDTATHLLTSSSAFASSWSGPAGSHHVLVDGVRNGWLMPDPASTRFESAESYKPAWLFTLGWVTSLATVAAFTVGLVVILEQRRRRYRSVHEPARRE